MKIIKTVLFAAFLLSVHFSEAQDEKVEFDIKPKEGLSKMEEFTGWRSEIVKFKDGTTATIDYRFALAARKGIACHYDVEVKNTSEVKLTVVVSSTYYDKLVKRSFNEIKEESLKPGKSAVSRLIAQGCKKDKGSDLDDFATCMACDFAASIFVTK